MKDVPGTLTFRPCAEEILVLALLVLSGTSPAVQTSDVLSSRTMTYRIVDTGQSICYDATTVIAPPSPGSAFHGQDAQHAGHQPSYSISKDGLTVLDNVTGLTWQRSPDRNRDGVINRSDKVTWAEVHAYVAALKNAKFGGYSDWRLPSIKELYSLIDFRGTDPRPEAGNSGLTPFIDTRYFAFGYGDMAAGERVIDAQYWSYTHYLGTAMRPSHAVFGVNFADGRIKGYPRDIGPRGTAFNMYVRCVRGPPYGTNDFVKSADGTITDRATGLIWAQADSGAGMNWPDALAWVQKQNAASYLGHKDWRLPNVKELQSIVEYYRSPATSNSPAISPLFQCTQIRNEAGQPDFPSYWSSTTHVSAGPRAGGSACYVAFGRAMGFMRDSWQDVHGAGAQRSDPKVGNPADYPRGRGPQGDAIRILNYVRLVRDLPRAAQTFE